MMRASQTSGFSDSVDKKRNRSAESASATSSNVDVPKATCVRSIDTSSSSSVSGQLEYEYDVFLSFRGEDTRKGFTDSLYTALEGAGIRVFRDNEGLAVGKEIGLDLLHGIKHSSISIPIFSENYASSKWCLEELAFMMECREERKQIVLPIFYDVTPNQVQHQTGSYDSAFRQHAEKRVPETVRRWRQALAEVGSLKGWDLEKDANGHQGKLIKMIVTKVSRELKKDHLYVSNDLVGIDDKVEEVMGMLHVEAPDVRFVGIWGMGGIGKTTLAKSVYNRVVDDFDGCSFLQDVRETSKHSHNGVRRLQSQLFADLLKWDRHQDFATFDEGINELGRRFREKKVLILLDDVDEVDQLSALAAKDWFRRGSRIIITTRNKDVLKEVEEHQVYEVREMGAAEALQLFCKHALREDAPSVRLRALSEEIVERTGGLPLALEVIGSSLHGKSEVVWESTSHKLTLMPNKKVQNTLRISYDALEHEQQQMFLDVACLFIGEDKRNVADIWEDRYEFPPEANIKELQLRSLIRIGEDNRLRMHDQLRDLGREIVRQENYEEPGKRSRLWGKKAIDVLQNNQGSRSIEAIRLEYEIGLENCCFTAEQFRELSNLRFLQLGRANLAGNFEHLLPELRWLRWRISPFSSTATNLNLKKVLILEVSRSQFTHDWIFGTQFRNTEMMRASRSLWFFNSILKRRRSAKSPATSSDVDVPKATCIRSIDTSISSSVSGLLEYEYDVFLSFRGEDTRKSFTDSLFTTLEGAGIRVFRDNERLAVDEEIGPEILHGIKHSSISIPIFSENYASSKLCLEEFAFMMECREARKQIVLPVFYDVTPNQVQHQTGSYDSAFRQHAEKQDTETVQRWREALAKVGSLKGWELKNETNGHQVKLIMMIVAKVLKELKEAYLCAGNNLVGIEDKVKAVMEMLDVDAPDVRFVWIWGMGGIGKTTLAKVVYNRILDDFDGCSFLQDVRETSKHSHNGVRQLQSQLVADLLRCDCQDFATVDEGINELRRRFREKKVLILLDNVDADDQLSALAAEVDWFGRGSRIIITTRNKGVLRAVAEEHQVYEVREMGATEALQLFCKHALRKDAPPVRLRALSEEIVRTTGGLPLALEVIGSFLHGKSEEVWKLTSHKLKRMSNKEVENKLRISYDALERKQQQMFLDVACLFFGEDKRNVANIWEDRYKFPPEADIEVLQVPSFIRIGEDNRVGMQDQLQDLGREIVRQENYKEPGKRSRLWGKEAVDVLQSNQGSRSIEAIRLEYEIGLENCIFTAEQFRELSNLRFLQLGRANLAGNFEHLLPELRWLRWRISPLSSTATNLNLKKVLILEVSRSRFTHDWIFGTQFSAIRR